MTISSIPPQRNPRRLFEDLERAEDAVVAIDPAGTIAFVNAALERLYGADRAQLLGRPDSRLFPEELTVRGQRERSRGRRAGAQPRKRRFQLMRYGAETYISVSTETVVARGLTLAVHRLSEIGGDDARGPGDPHYYELVQSAAAAIIATDASGNVTSWNPAAEALLGYEESEIRGMSLSVLAPVLQAREQRAILARAAVGEWSGQYEAVFVRKDGSQIDVATMISPLRFRDGRIGGVVIFARDNSDRRRQEDHLRFLAEHDPLTGALNRGRFADSVDLQLDRGRRYQESAALLLIDVDDFKWINDTHGHLAGDRVLIALVARVRTRVRSTDIVGRIGGDEFAVLLPHATHEQAEATVAGLHEVIERIPIDIGDGMQVMAAASIGIAHTDQHQDAESLLAAADQAMYRQKHPGT